MYNYAYITVKRNHKPLTILYTFKFQPVTGKNRK